MKGLLTRFADEIADGYVLGPLRAVLGCLLGWQALVAASELGRFGYFGSAFHVSMLPDILVPSHRMYAVVLAARVCLAVMVIIGVWARPALMISALLGTWMLLCDRNQFHHNRYSLYCFALLISLAPSDRSWRIADSEDDPARRGPYWAARLAALQVSLIYLASGGSKLLDADWRNGVVVADRIARYGHVAVKLGVPANVVSFLARADISSAVAKLAITTELALCLGLWLRRTRVIALWWGVWFHIAIQVTSQVEAFAVLSLAMYTTFATPDHRARGLRFDPSRPAGKIIGTLVPLLDWLARFEVAPWEPDDQPGHSFVVVRRDGGRVTGVRAFAMLTRCLPLLFPLWAPVELVASFTKQGDLTTRG